MDQCGINSVISLIAAEKEVLDQGLAEGEFNNNERTSLKYFKMWIVEYLEANNKKYPEDWGITFTEEVFDSFIMDQAIKEASSNSSTPSKSSQFLSLEPDDSNSITSIGTSESKGAVSYTHLTLPTKA